MRLRTRTWLSTLGGGAVAIVLLMVLRAAGIAFPLAVTIAAAGSALAAFAWAAIEGASLSRRLRAISAVSARYKQGDLTRPPRDDGDDEVGAVARMLDDAVHVLGRRLEESARSRSHMEAILSGMFESVVLVNGAGRLLLANAAARDMLQIPEAPEGRHYLEIIRHPDAAQLLGAALAGRAGEQVEVSLGRDPRRIFAARSSPVSGPQGSGAVLVLHDITALQRAHQIRRDFVANVSHELRTPLTAVRGYVEALLDSPPDALEQRRFLEIIARHTMRMERLVKDLLRLARLDAGQEELETSELTIQGLMIGIETELEPALATRKMRLALSVEEGAGSIAGDPAKLHDALRNLVENAVHYGGEGTTVDIGVSRGGDDLVITIADRGPGVPAADLDRIFERFYRVDRARTRAPGGTGLGLAIVKHLIGLHGGSVKAANREGGGALFTVRLPQPR